MRRIAVSLLGAVALCACEEAIPSRADGASPSPPTEATAGAAEYTVSGVGLRPAIGSVVIALTPDPNGTWFSIRVKDPPGGELWTLHLLGTGPGIPASDDAVLRYVFEPASGPALEWVDLATGEPVLPSIGFFSLLPRPDNDEAGLFEAGTYLGRPIRRTERAAALTIPDEIRRVELRSDCLIGTARPFRDDGTGPGPDGSWTWQDLTPADYRTMMDAGFNVFRVPEKDLPNVLEQDVWFYMYEGIERHPGLLYRSNYLGPVMYMDEPAARASSLDLFHRLERPDEAARLLVEITRGRYLGDTGYGCGYLDLVFRQNGCDVGVSVEHPDIPVWEGIDGVAWYELEAGPPAWISQSRYQPVRFSERIRSRFGVEFPSDPGSRIRFHYAMLTGAARHFGADWGVGLYGQMDPAATDLAFPIAWDLGARYFYLWTSDYTHHVPWERQLQLVRDFVEYRDAHPRAVRPGERASPAREAIALPWGYVLDWYAIRPGGGAKGGRLWWSDAMSLDRENRRGVPYERILGLGFGEAARLLRAGTRFDILFLKGGEKATGYDRVYRILETGETRIE